MGAELRAVPRRTAFSFAVLTLGLLAVALVRPLSVDEGQYVAATALTAKGLQPYRDFAYLQTPLQPFVFAPLQWLFAGHLLIAMRLANALVGASLAVLVYLTARRVGAPERGALIAALLLTFCQSFIWCAGVARNDMLPAVAMTAGLYAIAGGGSRVRLASAGIAFGLAAGVKISYAVPAATVFIAGLWTRNGADRSRALWFAAGVAAGLLPTILLAALAPRAFLAEAIVFPATAPVQYYGEIGKGWRLGPARFVQLLAAAAVGPALIAAVEAAWRGRKERWLDDRARRAMIAAAAGGLLSATLNKPFQIFYLLPALPPLFVLTALLFGGGGLGRSSLSKALWALFIVAGTVPVAAWFGRAATHGIPALGADRRSAALADALDRLGAHGPVATLAGQYVASVDPRFAASPFLYRTHGFLSDQDAFKWRIVTRDRSGSLARSRPETFVTGDYPDAQPELEARLAAQAASLGYRPTASAGGFTIWTAR